MSENELENMSYGTDLKHEIKEEVLDNDETTDEFKDDINQISAKLEDTKPPEYYESQNNPGIKKEYLEDLQNVTINSNNPLEVIKNETDTFNYDLTIAKNENLQNDQIESEDPLNINNQQKSKLKQLHRKFKSCNICSKSFKDSYNLNRHVSSVHEKKNNFQNDETKEKFECEYCQKTFSKKSNMKSHISIVHDGVKKFNCNECGLAFARNFEYKRHLITVHSVIDPESADLVLPGYSSSTKRYPRIRRDYKCDQCDKTYTRPTRLKTHIAQAHMGEKMYCCQHCGKDFIGNF